MRLKQMNIILIVLSLILLQTVNASFITLQTTLESTEEQVILSITNKGDESAFNVQPRLLSPKQVDSELMEELKIDQTLEDTLNINTADLLPGSYPLILNIAYTDANNYPFSAIATSILNIGQKTNPRLVLSLEPVKLSGSENIKLEIKNLDENKKEVTARLIVPTELSVSSEKNIEIAPRDSEKISFKLEDFSARPDSNYAIFAVVEYEQDGKHFTSIAPTTVLIVKNINFSTSILTISLAVLILIFIIYKLKKKNESKRSNTNLE